jgi:hypothetical protein
MQLAGTMARVHGAEAIERTKLKGKSQQRTEKVHICYYISLDRLFHDQLPFVLVVQWHKGEGNALGELIENNGIRRRVPRMLLASNKEKLRDRLDIYLMCTEYYPESIIYNL